MFLLAGTCEINQKNPTCVEGKWPWGSVFLLVDHLQVHPWPLLIFLMGLIMHAIEEVAKRLLITYWLSKLLQIDSYFTVNEISLYIIGIYPEENCFWIYCYHLVFLIWKYLYSYFLSIYLFSFFEMYFASLAFCFCAIVCKKAFWLNSSNFLRFL